eukprot:TRINITY_DN8106_c0_g1_i1.p3 TRINITY_DN8106_c0_g1~~TRINITY_DN8106_c0_g1_i1.p3  ORF type:complete len:207 (+),score=23.30 TRINITY_DN8106_c0_g1_i1:42-623(+)
MVVAGATATRETGATHATRATRATGVTGATGATTVPPATTVTSVARAPGGAGGVTAPAACGHGAAARMAGGGEGPQAVPAVVVHRRGGQRRDVRRVGARLRDGSAAAWLVLGGVAAPVGGRPVGGRPVLRRALERILLGDGTRVEAETPGQCTGEGCDAARLLALVAWRVTGGVCLDGASCQRQENATRGKGQ